jgi:hypothetical protein
MKKASRIILWISGGLLLVLGLVFSVVEARLLFSGDIALYAHPTSAYFRTAFRLLCALAALFAGVLPFLFIKKEHPVLRIYLYVFAILLFLMGNLFTTLLKDMEGNSPLYLRLPLSLIPDLYFVGAVLSYLSQNEKGVGSGNQKGDDSATNSTH